MTTAATIPPTYTALRVVTGAAFLVGLVVGPPLLPPEPELDAAVTLTPTNSVADALLLLG
jgi:hypothetical protein